MIKYKKCPRCNAKNGLNDNKCFNCGLIFERMKKTTNRAGKQALRKKEFNKVVYTSELPKDLNKWKLFFLTLFFGLFGVHYAYVGRKKIFIFTIISLFLLLIYSFFIYFNVYPVFFETNLALIIFVMPYVFVMILYFSCIVQILTNTFKVPVSIDEEYIIESLDKNVVTNILKDVKNNKDLKNEK